jgi:putative oxidoreductase
MNLGLLILRIVLGLLLVGHGSQKLFGAFGGHGLEGTGGFFASIGFRPGKPMAFVAGLSEFGAGVLLVLGLATPLAAAAVVGTMLVAGSVHASKGLWAQNGGYELALVYAVLGAVLALTGPGAYALDAVLGLHLGTPLNVAAVALGVVAGLVVVVRAGTTMRAEALAAK